MIPELAITGLVTAVTVLLGLRRVYANKVLDAMRLIATFVGLAIYFLCAYSYVRQDVWGSTGVAILSLFLTGYSLSKVWKGFRAWYGVSALSFATFSACITFFVVEKLF